MSQAPNLPEELLLDYAAGSCSPAMSLLMATHLAMSERSRKLVDMLEGMGGVLLESLEGEPLEQLTAMSVLEKIDSEADQDGPGGEALSRSKTAASDLDALVPAYFGEDLPPQPLRPYASDFSSKRAWQQLGWSVATAKLSISETGDRAHLLWAKPGAGIATHRHVGREVVLVLKGAFWDEGVCYRPGDIAVGEDRTIHTPRIDDEAECVCLAVTEAPVKFVGSFSWVLNRFCRF